MMTWTLIVAVVAACTARATHAAMCHGKPSPSATANKYPVDTDAPRFIKASKGGKLFSVGNGEDAFYILHVYGSPYDMGFAHGTLLKEEASNMINRVWQYMEDEIVGPAKRKLEFMDWFLDDVANFGLDAALGLEALATEKYTLRSFFDELRGLADATGQEYRKILYIHLIGELTKGSCSMLGAWGSSVDKAGSLIQLRALDWAVDGPFKDFPQVTVYHPSDSKDGHAWANFGWTGWVGSITGMNSQKMAISEIGVAFPDETFGKESRFGTPFTNVLRDILAFDSTLDGATKRIKSAKRTCDLILGVGDGKNQSFRGIEYSASTANFFDDKNLQPVASWHPRITDVVYYGMDWLCPAYSQTLAQQITKYHGHINASVVMHDMVSIVQTGNMQVAVYDLTENIAYLANARASNETGPQYAYERQFVMMNMTEIFLEPVP